MVSGLLASASLWALGGILLCVIVLCAAHIAAGRSKVRKSWTPVLEAEVNLWFAKSCAELVSDLSDTQNYQVMFESKRYQVEVELLENTTKYVHVMVGVDDGSMPASVRPLTTSFRRDKNGADSFE
jgi:hypothetical protein